MEEVDQNRGSLISAAPLERLKSPLGPLLGRSWSAIGRSWGHLGAIWGPSWGSLGQSWSHLESSDGHWTRKGENTRISGFPQVMEGCWPLGGPPRRLRGHLRPSWGNHGASWRHLWGHLAPTWTILGSLGGHGEASGAIFEPSWAKSLPRMPPKIQHLQCFR